MRTSLVVAFAIALAACANAFAAPATSLSITYSPEGLGGPRQTWTLRCSPTGGTHPRRAAACRRLAQVVQPFRAVPAEAVCTQIYGGPDVALVRGTFRGRRVWTYFRLRDGCEINRWQRVVPLLPARGA